MTKHAIKFSLGALGLVIVGFGVLFILRYLNLENRQMREAERIVEEIKEQYLSDTYGGNTPEETLQLFIDALKKGDTDLAAKYFVLDKQEEWKKDLVQIKDKGLLNEMVKDLEREKEKKVSGNDRVVFYIYNDNNELALGITLIKGVNLRWKIEDL
ncbi:MAG: hypothetical protein U1A23_00915 [Candidatus Sungbacteria bacterium]|nr:hypothetical protein [bacterium]MDZ4285469.1 hypothetical protein [Candidatus Sungbacteria bacterium]